MSTPNKLRGSTGPVPELTKLKLLWRDSLSESARAFWRSRFGSADTQSALREQLRSKLKINLADDSQLTRFRDWLSEQDAMEAEAERQADEEARLAKQHPDWDAERLRTEVIAGSLRRAMVSGDFKGLGLPAVRTSQAEESAKFNAELEKLKLELKRKDQQLDERRVLLLEKKASAFDQAKAVVQSNLSPAEQKARLKEILK